MKNPSVIIIGAGSAGIATASKLYENFVQNLTILEAEDRIGGRICSISFGRDFVDLGAEYCHGEKNNIVYELIKKFNILEPGVESLVENIYYSNGDKFKGSFVQELVGLISEYEDIEVDGYDKSGKSLGDLFSHKYYSKMLEECKFENQLVKEGLKFAEGYINMVEGTYSWNDVSADSNYEVCEGDQTLVFKKLGYKTILDVLMKNSSFQDKIQLNSKVEKIIWDKNQSVTVITAMKSYTADYVVFTPSLAVLKQKKDSIFYPNLPHSKQKAIENLGFAGVAKIVVQFTEKWWKDEDRAFSFFWSEADLGKIDFPHGPKSNNISWVSQLRDFSKVLHNPNVWIGWFSGDLVPKIEQLPLEILKSGCQYVLDKFLKRDYNVSNIDKIVSTKWCTNENFGGVYSYVKTGNYKKNLTDQEILAEPLKDINGRSVIFFAGEATNPIHYATVHGAIESGFATAENLLKAIQENNNE